MISRPTIAAAPPPLIPTSFPSGSTLIDLTNGEGWGLGRVVNLVGDKSSGKTLLAIEACANFARLYGTANIRYNETEAAFSHEYAHSIGLPKGIAFCSSETVEELFADLDKFIQDRTGPCLYIVDSFDALTDNEELDKEFGKRTYTRKAANSSELFRRLIRRLEAIHCTLFIVSQVRENIGVTFGERFVRSGGKALDFYASQICWLHEKGRIKETILGAERVTGVNVRVLNKKNKIGVPWAQVDVALQFGYGVDDELSMIEWLKVYHKKGDFAYPLVEYEKMVLKARREADRPVVDELRGQLSVYVRERWEEIRERMRPKLAKYA